MANVNIVMFQSLLRKAIGSRSQKEFAEIAGLSPFRLNRMLNDTDKSFSIPRKSTLRKISEASEGRVQETQLLYVCGYAEEIAAPDSIDLEISPEEENIRIAIRYKEKLERASGSALKYASLYDFLYMASLTSGVSSIKNKVLSDTEYRGLGYKNAENIAHCSTHWITSWYDSRLDFSILYCKTTKGGVVISDVVFDLESLNELRHINADNFIFHMAEKGDVNFADFPIVLSTKKHVPEEIEVKMLKAIFGENNNSIE